jgi:ribosomal protein S27AE
LVVDRKCRTCGEVKGVTSFSKHSSSPDGIRTQCKACANEAERLRRLHNGDEMRAKDRARGCRLTASDLQKYRKENPLKCKAHGAVYRAVKSGLIIKPSSCEECGSELGIHGHHDDYTKPLEVRWLCARCHHQWHALNGEAKTA